VNTIDGLELSHCDSLHIGAAETLFRDFVPTVLIDNSATDRSMVHRRAREIFSTQRTKILELSTAEQFRIAPEVTGKVLFPPRGFAAKTADDQALVLQLSVKTVKILFVSDSGYATEKTLLGSKSDLRSDILVKGQHYSGNSGLDAFLDAVQPRLIIATSRDFPQRERIPDEWAERLRARGIKLFRQDETGAVELEFNNRGGLEARAYANGEIFRSANR
jgi:competence protein ComEC